MASSKKFGQVVDLSKLLGSRDRLKSRISSIGIELEGGWKENPLPFQILRDGSVRVPGYWQVGSGSPRQPGEGLAGELPSPILGLSEWRDWLRKFYPEAISAACGMHVHMGFDHALYYMKTLTPDLMATVVERFKDWAADRRLPETHPIWPRLRGESRYCQHVYYGPEQIVVTGKDFDQERDGHRYTVFNYPYSRTGTVECRLLPMMDTVDLAIDAIQELLDITNAFLVSTGNQRERKVSTACVADVDPTAHLRQIYIS